MYVRLYRLLARRPEFLTHDADTRLDAAWDVGGVPVLDRNMLRRARELDRLCGYAVRKLQNRTSASVLDVLGVLDPLRIVAMYYALPRERRVSVLRDPA